jgi:hypothetical protein
MSLNKETMETMGIIIFLLKVMFAYYRKLESIDRKRNT